MLSLISKSLITYLKNFKNQYYFNNYYNLHFYIIVFVIITDINNII